MGAHGRRMGRWEGVGVSVVAHPSDDAVSPPRWGGVVVVHQAFMRGRRRANVNGREAIEACRSQPRWSCRNRRQRRRADETGQAAPAATDSPGWEEKRWCWCSLVQVDPRSRLLWRSLVKLSPIPGTGPTTHHAPPPPPLRPRLILSSPPPRPDHPLPKPSAGGARAIPAALPLRQRCWERYERQWPRHLTRRLQGPREIATSTDGLLACLCQLPTCHSLLDLSPSAHPPFASSFHAAAIGRIFSILDRRRS